MREATERGLTIPVATAFRAVPGQGVEAMVDGRRVTVGRPAFVAEGVVPQEIDGTPVVVALDGEAVAVLGIADALKTGSIEAVAGLRRLGIEVVLLTGDDRRTADSIARAAGIERVLADVRPEGKAAAIRELQGEGRAVAMAGDGINDAPALAAADVGIAMGSGTDVAIESAGVTLLSGDLRGLATAHPALARDDAKHPPEPVLGVRLQRAAHPGRDGRAVSVRRDPPRPDHRGRRDGHQLGDRRLERAATAELPRRACEHGRNAPGGPRDLLSEAGSYTRSVRTRPVGQAPGAAPREIAVEPLPAPAEEAIPAPRAPVRRPPGLLGRVRETFIALEERDFRIFWLGQLVSVTGTWMQTVAQGWLVLQLTGSPFVLGLAAAARSVPVLILAFPAGVVADRFDRREDRHHDERRCGDRLERCSGSWRSPARSPCRSSS